MLIEKASAEQLNTLKAICGDLTQLNWHGFHMTRDDWRHMLCGIAKGWRMVPAPYQGDDGARFVMLGGTSKDLSARQASEAIDLGLQVGTRPDDYGASGSVRWSRATTLGCFIEKDKQQ